MSYRTPARGDRLAGVKAICLVKQVPALGVDRVRRGDALAQARRRAARAERLRPVCGAARRPARGRDRGDDHGPAAGRGGAARGARARSPAGDPSLGSRVRGRGHARDLAHARDGDREGRRRSRPVRAQGARFGDLAGAVPGGRVPRLAARHERGGGRALGRHAPAHAAHRLRRGGVRGRASRSSSPSASRPSRRRAAMRTARSRSGRRPISSTRSSSTTSASARPDRRRACSRSATPGPSVPGSAPRAQTRRPRKSASCSRSARPRHRAGRSPPTSQRSPAASYDCWSVCELVDGRPRRVSLELIARSRELAGKLGGRAVALLIGHELDEPAREAALHGAEVVYLADDPALAEYHPELWTAVLRRVLVEHLPRVAAGPRDRPRSGLRPAHGGRTGARNDRGLRRRRHRQGGPPAPTEAGLRRQHRLGHHWRDDSAARDRASRACTSRSSRRTSMRRSIASTSARCRSRK